MIYSKITCRLVKLKNAPNCHINKNFTRNYNIESGSNWQKISFPNPDIEKYTFSFISNDVTYHLLGIVPYHKHSDVVVKEFANTLKKRKPTVLLDTILFDPYEEDFNKLPDPTFFQFFSKSYGLKYIESLRPLINDYARPRAYNIAQTLFLEGESKVIRCGRKPSLIAARRFKNSGILERRRLLKQLQATSKLDTNTIYENSEGALSQFYYDELFLNNPLSITSSSSSIIIAENALNFCNHLKKVQDNNVVAGIIDYMAIDMIMYAWDKDIPWADDLNKLETSEVKTKQFIIEVMGEILSRNNSK